MTAQRLAHFESEARRQGLALTAQRRLILGELLTRRDHPTADQIYDTVRDRLPGLSRTTVYRVLDTLVRLGAARKVSHAGAVVRFDPNTERHHHLVCERCGTLVDIDPGKVGNIQLPDTSSMGFTIKDYSVNFSGTCQDCRDTTS